MNTFLVFQLQISFILCDNKYDSYILEESLNSAYLSDLAFFNDRGLALYAVSNAADTVQFSWFTPLPSGDILPSYFTITENPKLSSLDFGVSLEYARDHVSDNMLFVGAVDQASTNNNRGQVYYYRGAFKVWSVQQMLNAPKEFLEDSFFGMDVDIDPVNLRTLAVGCKNCNASGYLTGSVIIFEPINPRIDQWTQKQILSSKSTYLLGSRDVEIYDDLIIADYCLTATTTCSAPNIKAMLFQKDGDKWNDIQALGLTTLSNDYSVDSFAIYEDIIVLGMTLYDINFPTPVYTDLGAVYVLAPSGPRDLLEINGRIMKPKPNQWSIHQVLFENPKASNSKFGQEISIDGDTMIISNGLSPSSLYVYERDTQFNLWSLQQKLIGTSLVSKVELYGNAFATLDASSMKYFHSTTSWSCIIIEIDDHFGDGWDIAQLTIELPNGVQTLLGDIDHFESRCDLPNPFLFRYCPKDENDIGLHRISIKDGPRAKHHWEILWKIYEERTGLWFTGNWNTVIEMVWTYNKQFEIKKVEKNLSNNITCEKCPPRPTLKPTPHLRHLKGNDDTLHPTISPAPTVEVTNIINWRIMTLETTARYWFDPTHYGASYYISDAHSHKLIRVGTMCTDQVTKVECWVDLPDGTYVVRVGGDLSPYVNQFTWRYCKAVNDIPAQTQLIINIAYEDCTILAYHRRQAYCQNVLNFAAAAIVSMEFIILGSTLIDGNNERTINDQIVLKEAINQVIPGITSENIDIITMSNTEEGIFVKVNLEMDQVNTGYNFADIEGIESISNLRSYLQGSGSGLLRAGLVSGTHSNSFTKTTGINLISFEIIDSRDISLNEFHTFTGSYDIIDEPTLNFIELPTDNNSNKDLLMIIINVMSGIGYIIVILSILIFFLFRRRINRNKLNQTNLNKNNNNINSNCNIDGDIDGNIDVDAEEIYLNKESILRNTKLNNLDSISLIKDDYDDISSVSSDDSYFSNDDYYSSSNENDNRNHNSKIRSKSKGKNKNKSDGKNKSNKRSKSSNNVEIKSKTEKKRQNNYLL